jgi:CCR4-NOT transcription complex subunit 4
MSERIHNSKYTTSKIITKTKTETDINELAEARIITKNLVYIIGLSSKIANKSTLTSKEYFGQYGTINKIVVNKNKAYNQNNPKGPSFSAYVTYAKPHEASIAILSLDNIIIDDHLIRASFGTTKYLY